MEVRPQCYQNGHDFPITKLKLPSLMQIIQAGLLEQDLYRRGLLAAWDKIKRGSSRGGDEWSGKGH